jgi:hypothetical protein
LLNRAIVVFVASEPTERVRRKKMSKAMGQTTGGHNLRVTMVTLALAVMLLVLTLVVVVETIPTTSDSSSANPANHARSADGSGGSSITHDPYIDRHTEVVARHHRLIPH